MAGLVFAGVAVPQKLIPAVTFLAANSTNTANGTVTPVQQMNEVGAVRVYLTASGIAASTNGSLIVKISTACGTDSQTNAFDTADASTIKLTMSSLGAVTNTVSDWFQLSGVRYLRIGQIENTFGGVVSNIAVNISYQKP